MSKSQSIEERIDRLHAGGLVDMHFDLPLGLQWNEDPDAIAKEFLPEFVAGDIGVLGVATYVEDRFLDKGLNVALVPGRASLRRRGANGTDRDMQDV